MKHILFTIKGCKYELLDDELHIRNVLVNAAQLAESTLLDISSHKFDPHGVTAIALLAESHISIHTWPELQMAVCDVFTCGEHTSPGYIQLVMLPVTRQAHCQDAPRDLMLAIVCSEKWVMGIVGYSTGVL